jgi:hypothetical protein
MARVVVQHAHCGSGRGVARPRSRRRKPDGGRFARTTSWRAGRRCPDREGTCFYDLAVMNAPRWAARQVGAVRFRGCGAVLMAVLTLMCAACASSSAHTAPPTPAASSTTPSTRHRTPTTRRVTRKRPVNSVAADQLAQLALTSALTAAKSIYDQTYDFTAVTPTSLAPLVPNIKIVPFEDARDGMVGLLAQDRHDVFFVTRSASGRWYCITDNDTDGVSYGSGAAFADVQSNGQCQQRQWPAPGT